MFWQVGSSATLGTGTVFAGNILALTSITMNDGVTLHGRALARNGAVTLINDTITAAALRDRSRPPCPGPARELDVAAALAADPGVGANQGLRPNHAVEAALVDAGVDPTRATWTKGTWTQRAAGRKGTAVAPGRSGTWAQWTRAQWTQGHSGREAMRGVSVQRSAS